MNRFQSDPNPLQAKYNHIWLRLCWHHIAAVYIPPFCAYCPAEKNLSPSFLQIPIAQLQVPAPENSQTCVNIVFELTYVVSFVHSAANS